MIGSHQVAAEFIPPSMLFTFSMISLLPKNHPHYNTANKRQLNLHKNFFDNLMWEKLFPPWIASVKRCLFDFGKSTESTQTYSSCTRTTFWWVRCFFDGSIKTCHLCRRFQETIYQNPWSFNLFYCIIDNACWAEAPPPPLRQFGCRERVKIIAFLTNKFTALQNDGLCCVKK